MLNDVATRQQRRLDRKKERIANRMRRKQERIDKRNERKGLYNKDRVAEDSALAGTNTPKPTVDAPRPSNSLFLRWHPGGSISKDSRDEQGRKPRPPALSEPLWNDMRKRIRSQNEGVMIGDRRMHTLVAYPNLGDADTYEGYQDWHNKQYDETKYY